MNSLHTKLKELRELRERATPGPWDIYGEHKNMLIQTKHFTRDVWTVGEFLHDGQVDADFTSKAANHWLTLISALEKAVGALESIREVELFISPVGPKTALQEDCEKALAEIAEMLGKD